MNRIAGIETEYGCLVTEGGESGDAWPVRVKNHLFKKLHVGVLDQHYRDYEEPPGNGGFLLNGGRFYLDMGHIEYATPECRAVRDIVACDLAGDAMLQGAIEAMGVTDSVAFLKNNIDHGTNATFGCHENYLMRRETDFTEANTVALLSFLATRQIFTGAGRVGQASPLAFEVEPLPPYERVEFQMSQRADHIVNDIYQWVQFNRAIINARDEPLADYRRYRRLHLLIGDSNMSPFATAMKIGTTHLVLSLLEEDRLPRDVALQDAVLSTRMISRRCCARTATRTRRSACRKNFSLPRSRSRVAMPRRTGCSAAGPGCSTRCAGGQSRNCLARWTGSRRNGCSTLFARSRASRGATLGSKASISNTTISIRRAGSSTESPSRARRRSSTARRLTPHSCASRPRTPARTPAGWPSRIAWSGACRACSTGTR